MFDSHFHLFSGTSFVGDTENFGFTVGIHPEFAHTFNEKDFLHFVENNKDNPKFYAIGECGLDYHRPDLPSLDIQEKVFIRHIEIANLYNKPLVIHSRDAYRDTLKILKEHKPKNEFLLHCMSYDVEFAREFPDAYFSIGWFITVKKYKDMLEKVVRFIPRDKIVIETDAPYLAPRHDKIKEVAKRVGEILGMTAKEAEELTASNAKRFFRCL
ncbi:MAG: TatD family hydrolase [Christensenellaceae bacterium]|jgi:TatD DNase family protein|nr:TatD family hydrolase [Christensenellaceae bacterium]